MPDKTRTPDLPAVAPTEVTPVPNADVYGEPRGPRPPAFKRVDKPAREIRSDSEPGDPSGYAESDPGERDEGEDPHRGGFFGGVATSRERRKDGN